jgi:hypothetical protein
VGFYRRSNKSFCPVRPGDRAQRGEIDYIGQVDDDLVDLIATIHPEHANAALTLIGFSGGAFTIRIAGGLTAISSIDTS